ncbi:MAG TPA: 30S ribosomal protein THX [Bacteroidales bacterium]|nr:30S ribosomal protein THX [Bacteroidales bacterium]
MGKGDMKTKRGKIFRGSWGKSRPQKDAKHIKNVVPVAAKKLKVKK